MTLKNTYEVAVKHRGRNGNVSHYTYTISADTEERAGQRALNRVKRGRGGTAEIRHVRPLTPPHRRDEGVRS